MAFIDELKFNIKAGRGGHGVAAWRHTKNKEYAGPSGGDGGNGGNVYVRAVRDIGVLARYKAVKDFRAENGGSGEAEVRHGANGKDLVIDLPIGTLVKNLESGKVFELLDEGEKVLLLAGGRGGKGNTHYKSSINQSPRKFTPGLDGERGNFFVELRLIADVGIIGLPNAGKSSLLNVLTSASAKVGDYPFTTLDPNLGALFGFILADIPGLIEGASDGKGLGDKFLKHISRTKVLLHCVASDCEKPLDVYKVVRNELSKYDKELLKKPEIIVLTKTDLVSGDKVAEIESKFSSLGVEIIPVSIEKSDSIKNLSTTLITFLRKIK